MAENPSMADHPDLAEVKQAHDIEELRARYEHVAEMPMAQLMEGLLIVAGLYVALSTWIVGYGGPLTVNNLVVGLAVAILGLSFAVDYGSTHRIAWVCPVLGAWTIASLWAVNGVSISLGALLSNIIAGAVILLVGLAILSGAQADSEGSLSGAGRMHLSRTRFAKTPR
jgi:hypothetical protein